MSSENGQERAVKLSKGEVAGEIQECLKFLLLCKWTCLLSPRSGLMSLAQRRTSCSVLHGIMNFFRFLLREQSTPTLSVTDRGYVKSEILGSILTTQYEKVSSQKHNSNYAFVSILKRFQVNKERITSFVPVTCKTKQSF